MPTDLPAPTGLHPLVLVGMGSLALYAVLLGVGGFIGYVKARSKPSLIAGSIGAAVAMVALILSLMGGLGFWIGLVLAVLMTITFAMRFAKTRKFMPSGMLGAASLVMIVLMGLALWHAP